MERTTNKESKEKKNQKPLWKKISTGTLILRKPTQMRLKHKQEFAASAEELGRFFLDEINFEMVKNGTGKYKIKKGEKTGAEKIEDTAPATEGYTVEHTGGGWYNVLSPTGKSMSEKKLKAEPAEALRAQLQGETPE